MKHGCRHRVENGPSLPGAYNHPPLRLTHPPPPPLAEERRCRMCVCVGEGGRYGQSANRLAEGGGVGGGGGEV